MTTPSPHPAALLSFHQRKTSGAAAQGAVDAWVWCLTLSGQVDVTVTNPPRSLIEGTVLLIKPRTVNSWEVPKAVAGRERHWEVAYCTFIPRPHWYPWLQFPEFMPGMSILTFPPQLFAQIRQGQLEMHAIANGPSPHRTEFALNVLERMLLIAHADQGSAGNFDRRVRGAVDLLRSRLAEPITMRHLSERCEISRSHLAALFRAQVGCGPIEFHERQRLEHAARLLRMSFDSIGSIAAAAGFSDGKYFARRFRRRFGCTPRDYRQT